MSNDHNEHWVSDQPFNPDRTIELTPAQEKIYFASQWRLMWWKFKRHKLAMVSGIFLLGMYLMIPFVEFIAPYDLKTRHTAYIYSPPQPLNWFDESGKFRGPFVYGWKQTMDMQTLKREYTEDKSEIYPLQFLYRGEDYKMLGLIPGNLHLFGVEGKGRVFLLGTDRLGRDMLSRILHGARISLTIGLLGISVSFALGLLFGGLAGYYGGWIDNSVQRVTEIIRSFPELPLWMALSALLPVNWSPLWIFFGITLILALLDWTGLARAVRSKLMALREEDYASAAVLMGAKPTRVIIWHLFPGIFSHLVASATLSIPAMILGETALSFLGLGLRPPITSWGVLLNEAQNINIVALYPWLILPVVPVILVILAFNFLGDGLRDAADPYKH